MRRIGDEEIGGAVHDHAGFRRVGEGAVGLRPGVDRAHHDREAGGMPVASRRPAVIAPTISPGSTSSGASTPGSSCVQTSSRHVPLRAVIDRHELARGMVVDGVDAGEPGISQACAVNQRRIVREDLRLVRLQPEEFRDGRLHGDRRAARGDRRVAVVALFERGDLRQRACVDAVEDAGPERRAVRRRSAARSARWR